MVRFRAGMAEEHPDVYAAKAGFLRPLFLYLARALHLCFVVFESVIDTGQGGK
jgi:hypothetical protein